MVTLTPMSNDTSDFIDSDFQSAQKSAYAAPLANANGQSSAMPNRPPSREEIESMVSEKQIKLAELKRAQEELERERAGLEELRRRQMEFQTGREEMLQHLTRGVGLLEESEMATRREADQMARSLNEFRIATSKIQAINEQSWTQENLNVELTRALTTIENARLEWNAARLKFSVLSGINQEEPSKAGPKSSMASFLATADFLQLCKLGFAFTWPLTVIGFVFFLAWLLRHP